MEIILKVAEALSRRDVGRGVVRLDTSSKHNLGVGVSDVVEIIGRKKTCAAVWSASPEDEGKRIIRIDGLTRENARVSIGNKVRVRKALVVPALSVTLAPVVSEDPKAYFGIGIESLIKRKLLKRALMKGNIVLVPEAALMGGVLPLRVEQTFPRKIVRITEDTTIALSAGRE